MSETASAGMGEPDMKNFFRAQMLSILKPFAENVETLHSTVINLSDHVKAIEEQSQPYTGLHQQHAAGLTGVKGKQAHLNWEHEGTREVLHGWIEQSKRTELASSRRMEKLESSLPQLENAIAELRKIGDDTRTKLAACQDDGNTFRSQNLQLKSEVSGMSDDLHRMDQGRLSSLIETVKRHKVILDINTKEQEALKHEHEQLALELQEQRSMCEDKFKKLDAQNAEAQSQLLQYREESQQALDAKAQLLSGRLDAHDVVHDEIWARFKKIDEELANQNARMVENREHFNNLLKIQEEQHLADMKEVRNDLGDLHTLTSKHTKEIAELQTATGVLPGRAQNRIEILEEDAVLATKRNARVEQVLQLEPMTKENADSTKRVTLMHGVMLTDEQIEEFKVAFAKYDSDGSGSVDAQEVGDILRSLGLEVDKNIITLVLNEIDQDRSGEISFDEFCAMMSKMLGPDGKVEADGYLKSVAEAATREARQNEVVERFPAMQEEVKKHQNLIKEEQSKLNITTDRVQQLEKFHSDLLNEVDTLRMGMEKHNARWSGMTVGFEETKQTVHQKGTKEYLPNATKLRKAALPPLDDSFTPNQSAFINPKTSTLIEVATKKAATSRKDDAPKKNQPSFNSLFART